MILRALILSFCVLFFMTPYVCAGEDDPDGSSVVTRQAAHRALNTSVISENPTRSSSLHALRKSMMVDIGGSVGNCFLTLGTFTGNPTVDTIFNVCILGAAATSLVAKANFCRIYASGDFVTLNHGNRVSKKPLLALEGGLVLIPAGIIMMAVLGLTGTVETLTVGVFTLPACLTHICTFVKRSDFLDTTSLGSGETRSLLDV